MDDCLALQGQEVVELILKLNQLEYNWNYLKHEQGCLRFVEVIASLEYANVTNFEKPKIRAAIVGSCLGLAKSATN